jgi:hypothetical protein
MNKNQEEIVLILTIDAKASINFVLQTVLSNDYNLDKHVTTYQHT